MSRRMPLLATALIAMVMLLNANFLYAVRGKGSMERVKEIAMTTCY